MVRPVFISSLAVFILLLFTVNNAFAEEPATLDAEAFLQQVEAQLAADENDLQLIFTQGMLLAELGRYREAADAFRKMLTRDPDLLRPRLELARVLMTAGDYNSARYHFEQVLAHELPETVRLNVLRMLAVIREESPSFDFTLELVFDSNPKQATSSKEVEIDGLVFRLDEDARASSETGLRFLLDGRVPIGKPPLWFMRGYGEHLEFNGNNLDFTYLQFAGGRNFPFKDQTLTLEAGYHWSWYQHEPLYHGALWTASYFRSLRPDISLHLNLSGLQLIYPEYAYRNGWQHTPSATIVFASSLKSRWVAGMGYTINRARESIYSFDQPYVNLRYVREWPGGWITGIGMKASWIEYKDKEPFFGVTRSEREIRFEADVLNRRIRLWRLTPQFLVGYVDRASNLNLYTWKRSYVRLGMTAEF
jgi:outer membrane protein